ncbi:MAG: alpha/beta fold hydrolase [Solirubrobacterales bacterium]
MIAADPTAAAQAPPSYLRELTDRYDPDPIHVAGGEATIQLEVGGSEYWDAVISGGHCTLELPSDERDADARISADADTWRTIAADARNGMEAFQRGALSVRHDLHLGIGFIAATSGEEGPDRLSFAVVEPAGEGGEIAYLEAGAPDREIPLICVHGLGGTKASFMPTVAALADDERVIALDLPGFGDSHKPTDAPYDAEWFAAAVERFMDSLGIERAHLIGNSMGGRVAIECGFTIPERVASLSLITPSLAWIRDRPWRVLLSLPLPKLGLIQPTPRRVMEPIVRRLVPGAKEGWTAAGVDEFLRAFLTPGGRFAFYEAARRIYLDEPYGPEGFWRRLEQLVPPSLFVWGTEDMLVPASFRWHVERALPEARHIELDCGHVPQLERPTETHQAIAALLAEVEKESDGVPVG